jgi:hypothetical protein
VVLTNRHLSVLELVAKGAVMQGALAFNLRRKPSGRGYEWAEAERELVANGYILPPQRFAELLHRRCPAALTLWGWQAFNDAKLCEGQALPKREG